jgi:hypothetical protein
VEGGGHRAAQIPPPRLESGRPPASHHAGVGVGQDYCKIDEHSEQGIKLGLFVASEQRQEGAPEVEPDRG